MQDILKSFQTQIQERLASPLIGSFLVAWGIWNYKFFVILFSKNSVLETFYLINKISFPNWQSQIWDGVLIPLAWTMAYIFLYPYPAKYIYTAWSKAQQGINDIKRKFDDERLLSAAESRSLIEEYRQIRSKNNVIEVEHRGEIEAKDKEILELRIRLNDKPTLMPVALDQFSPASQNKAKENSAENFDEKSEDFFTSLTKKNRINLSDSQKRLLSEIASHKGSVREDFLIDNLPQPFVRTEFDLEELVQLNLITKFQESEYDSPFLSLTHEGKRYVVENDLV